MSVKIKAVPYKCYETLDEKGNMVCVHDTSNSGKDIHIYVNKAFYVNRKFTSDVVEKLEKYDGQSTREVIPDVEKELNELITFYTNMNQLVLEETTGGIEPPDMDYIPASHPAIVNELFN